MQALQTLVTHSSNHKARQINGIPNLSRNHSPGDDSTELKYYSPDEKEDPYDVVGITLRTKSLPDDLFRFLSFPILSISAMPGEV